MTRLTHRPEMHRGTDGGVFNADDVPITDAGGHFTATEVEGALQELGASSGGGGANLTAEVPSGTIDGTNAVFTLSSAPPAVILFKNGLLQRSGSGNDYTISGSTITYEAGNIPQTGDTHIAYVTSSGASSGLPDGVFGDGSDGDVTVNSGTFSVTGLLTNNVLLRDAYFNNLTLNGGDISTNGFKIYVKGTLTMTSGVIRYNGAPGGTGGNGSAAAGGSFGTAGAAGGVGTMFANAAGVAGRTGGFNAAGTNGLGGTANTMGRTGNPAGSAGGASGQGQAGGTGGSGGTTVNTATERPYDLWHAMTMRKYTAANFNMSPEIAATPGGGGSGGGAASSGGGGSGGNGASGGVVYLAAKTLTGSTNIEAKGGAGGNGGNGGGTDAGGGAGGNGGWGGLIVLLYRTRSGWSGSLVVTAGAAGTGGTGIGTGVAGDNGSAGVAGYTIEHQV